MPLFNPGDRVRRTRYSEPNYNYDPREFGVVGGIYTVRESELGAVRFVEIRGRCSPSCFELVTEAAPQAKAFFWLFVYKDSDGRVQKRAGRRARDSNAMKTTLQYRLAQGDISDLHMKKIAFNLPGGYDADV